MKPDLGCERVRPRLMAAIDGEVDAASAGDREHLAACESCRQWAGDLERMDASLRQLAYPDARVDLWARVEAGIRRIESRPNVVRQLQVIGALVLAWRALQLLIDLPLPALHPIVPIAAVAAALWLLAGDALAIKTSAPELQKRGV